MPRERMICDSCSAPLDVPETARFVTCNHCHMSLRINRGPDVSYTSRLNELEQRTAQIRDELETLKQGSLASTADRKLAALDREWQLTKEKFEHHGKHGNRFLPTRTGAIGGGLAIGLFGTFWTVMAYSITSSAPSHGPFVVMKYCFPLFGLLFTVGGVGMAVKQFHDAGLYETAERAYRLRRQQLLDELERE